MNAVPLTVSIVYHMSAWVRVCMCMRVQSQIMVHRWEDYFWESVFPFHLQTPGIRFEWKCFTCWTVLFILKDIFILKIILNYDQRLYTDIFILSECVALMDNALISVIINIHLKYKLSWFSFHCVKHIVGCRETYTKSRLLAIFFSLCNCLFHVYNICLILECDSLVAWTLIVLNKKILETDIRGWKLKDPRSIAASP